MLERLPRPRDAEEAQKMRAAYKLGAFDIIDAAECAKETRVDARGTVRRAVALLFPCFPVS